MAISRPSRLYDYRIVAVATINFSLAGVRLLIEGGSYSKTALEGYLCTDPVVSCCDRLVFQDYFLNSRDMMIENSSRIKPGMSSVMFLPRTDDRSWRANVATPT